MSEHLIKTVLDQGHLCPLPVTIRPVYWNYDHALRLYPPPDLLILADTHDEFEKSYFDVKCICPDDFNARGRFIAYFPAAREVEFSQIPSATT